MEEKTQVGVTAYSGSAPYIFISYAHKDAAVVLPALSAMEKSGYRVWFDQGIEAGTEWSNNIASHLRDCAVFVAFISKNSVSSENCLDEIAYAKSHQKPSLMIFLEEDVVLPEGTEMQTARFQRMYYYRQESLDLFAANLKRSPLLDPCRGEEVEEVLSPAKGSPREKKLPDRKKGFVAIAAIALVAIVSLCLILALGGKDAPETPVDTGEQGAQEKPVSMSDDLMDFTFRLEGEVYQLPFHFSKLVDNGWTISTTGVNAQTAVPGMKAVEFNMVKDGKRIGIAVYNDGGDQITVSESRVGEICVERGDEVDFVIAKGITPASAQEQILEAFGAPANRSDQSSYSYFYYQSRTNEDEKASFYCYKEGNQEKYSSITLERYLVEENKTQTRDERPSYLDSYKAPASLGNDPLSAIFSAEGVLYQLPAPVSAFLDQGWTVGSGPSAVVSGGKEYITLVRDGKKLELEIENLATYQTTPKNCVVTAVSESGKTSALTLPGGLKLGMDRAAVERLLPSEMEKNEGSYTVTYRYFESNKERDFTLSLSLDKETGLLESIRIKNGILAAK